MSLVLLSAMVLAQPTVDVLGADGPDAVYDASPIRLQSALAISRDGKLLAASEPERTIVWNVESKKKVASLMHPGHLTAVVFSPASDILVTANNKGTMKLWDTTTWEQKATLRDRGGFWSLCFSPDGKTLVSGGTWKGAGVVFWDVAKGVRLTGVGDQDKSIFRVSFSADGRMVASGVGGPEGPGKISIWDAESTRLIREFPVKPRWIPSISFSPDSKKLACVSDGKLSLWDPATGKELEIRTKAYVQENVRQVCWSPTGRYLVTCSNQVQIIDMEKPARIIRGPLMPFDTTKPLHERAKTMEGAHRACFSPDGKYLFTAGATSKVLRWKME